MDLYLLQDGTHVQPSDVSPDKKGVLRSKSGLAVCLYEDGSPQTVAQDAVLNKNVMAAKVGTGNLSAPDEPAKGPEPLLATTASVAHDPTV